MRALINKELRELLPPAVFLLAIAAVLGTLDLVYNWREDHCLGISLGICLVIGFAVAVLGGANALARETRDHLSFLATWPLRRRTIWLVKLALNLGVAALAVALSFAICLDLVGMRGFTMTGLRHTLGDTGAPVLVGLWLACYGLSFFWSALVRIPLAAAGLGFATTALFAFGLSYLVIAYLPDRWGPWLGFDPSRLSEAEADGLTVGIASAVAVVAFAASALAFIRTPVLEAWRRAFRGLVWLLGLTLSLIFVSLAAYWLVTRPSLTDVSEAYLDRDGRHILLSSTGDHAGVWVADLERGEPRLVARGGQGTGPDSSGGPRVLIIWGHNSYRYWALDLRTGQLRRQDGEIAAVSPSGRLQCRLADEGLRIEDESGKLVRQYPGESPTGQPVFSTDDRYLYMVAPDDTRGPRRSPGTGAMPGAVPYRVPPLPSLLVRLDIATGESTTIAHLPGSPYLLWLSPGGSHMAVTAEHALTLVDLATGRQRTFRSIFPTSMDWVGDDRYLWCRELPASRKTPRGYQLFDVQAMTVARTIGQRDMQAAAGPSLPASEVAQQSVLVAQPRRDDGPIFFASRVLGSKSPEKLLWAANVDGTGLRFVRRESRPWLGVAATGELVFWERSATASTPWGSPAGPNRVILLDPSTGRERVLFSAP